MMDRIDAVRQCFASGSPALAAFDHLLEEAKCAGFRLVPRLSAVRSIELQWPDRRQNPFSAQANPQHINFYLRRPILKEHLQLYLAASREFGQVRPNRLGEYRAHLKTPADVDRMISFLSLNGAWPQPTSAR
jgi:hypothetical protein